jgi:hypothetical protein
MKHDDKQAIALWRLGVLGPLTSARRVLAAAVLEVRRSS